MSDSTFLAVDRKSNLVTLYARAAPALTGLASVDVQLTQYCDLQGRPAVYLGNDTFRLYDGTLARRSGNVLASDA